MAGFGSGKFGPVIQARACSWSFDAYGHEKITADVFDAVFVRGELSEQRLELTFAV